MLRIMQDNVHIVKQDRTKKNNTSPPTLSFITLRNNRNCLTAKKSTQVCKVTH